MPGEIFWRINTEKVTDDKAMGEKHAPIITLPAELVAGEKAKIRVYVGGGKHPNTNEHHTQWVELFIDGLFTARVDFTPVIMEPEVEFTVVIPRHPVKEISAISRCNLHGLWENKVACSVKM